MTRCGSDTTIPARMRWALVERGDPAANALANRHYSRRRRASNVGPPGAPVVLRTPEGDALWVASSSDFERAGPYPWSWCCNYFRNESPHRASELIREALAVTRRQLGDPPADGLITHVDPAKVQRTRKPGRVFYLAGFEFVRITAGGHGRNPLHELRCPAYGQAQAIAALTPDVFESPLATPDARDLRIACRTAAADQFEDEQFREWKTRFLLERKVPA